MGAALGGFRWEPGAETSCSGIGAKERKGCVKLELLLAWSGGLWTRHRLGSKPASPGQSRKPACLGGMRLNCSLNNFLCRDYTGGRVLGLFPSPAPL